MPVLVLVIQAEWNVSKTQKSVLNMVYTEVLLQWRYSIMYAPSVTADQDMQA